MTTGSKIVYKQDQRSSLSAAPNLDAEFTKNTTFICSPFGKIQVSCFSILLQFMLHPFSRRPQNHLVQLQLLNHSQIIIEQKRKDQNFNTPNQKGIQKTS